MKCESILKAANEILEEANIKLQKELSNKNKHLDRIKIQCVQLKIEIGIQRKRKLESDLENLKFKQNKHLQYMSKGSEGDRNRESKRFLFLLYFVKFRKYFFDVLLSFATKVLLELLHAIEWSFVFCVDSVVYI